MGVLRVMIRTKALEFQGLFVLHASRGLGKSFIVH